MTGADAIRYPLDNREWVMCLRHAILMHTTKAPPPPTPAELAARQHAKLQDHTQRMTMMQQQLQHGGLSQHQQQLLQQQMSVQQRSWQSYQAECAKPGYGRSEPAKSTPTPLLVVGTVINEGEQRNCTGRLLLFDVEKLAPASAREGPGEAEGGAAVAEAVAPVSGAQRRLRLVREQEERGGVTALAPIDGTLLTAVGPKLVISAYRDTALVSLGFYICGFGVCSLAVMKNYILAGDLHQGLHLLSWKADKQSLSAVAKFLGVGSCYACEFMLQAVGGLLDSRPLTLGAPAGLTSDGGHSPAGVPPPPRSLRGGDAALPGRAAFGPPPLQLLSAGVSAPSPRRVTTR